MDTIIACPRGHRYRVFVLSRNKFTTCPRCDLAELIALAYGDCQKPPRSCRLLNFRSEPIQDFQVLSEMLSLIWPYNRFRPTAVLRELGPLFPKLSGIEIGVRAARSCTPGSRTGPTRQSNGREPVWASRSGPRSATL